MQRTGLLLGLVVLCAVSALMSPVTSVEFYSPTIQGKALDFCPSLSSKPEDCGLPVANAFCTSLRPKAIVLSYSRATVFTGPVPAPGNKTLTIKSQESCTSSSNKACQTFGMINCIQNWLFTNPMIQGKRLDWCLQGSQGCGKEAANYFCKQQGYSLGAASYDGPYSPRFNTDPEGGHYTYQATSGRTCNAKTEQCLTFSRINCER